MNSLILLIFALVDFCLVVGLLWLTNFKKEHRYKQLPLVILSVIFSFSILHFDKILSNKLIDHLFSTYPFLEQLSLFFYNLIILTLFLFIKLSWKVCGSGILFVINWCNSRNKSGKKHPHWLAKIIQKLPDNIKRSFLAKKSRKRVISFVYVEDIHGIYLKPEWVFPQKLFLATSLIPGLLIILYMMTGILEQLKIIHPFLPNYPALSLLVLLEMAWFLGGKTRSYQKETFSGSDSISVIRLNYEQLFDKYHQLWNKSILSSGHIEFPKANNMTMLKSSTIDQSHQAIQKQLNEIINRLKKRKISLTKHNIEIIKNILLEKDVLVKDPIYNDIRHYLFPSIHAMLVKNKRLIVIVKDKPTAYIAINWIKEGIRESSGLDFLWNITTFENMIEDNIDTHILVLTPENLVDNSLYDYMKNHYGSAFFELVFMMEIEQILTEYGTILHSFILRLEDYLKKSPQFIIFSKWIKDLDVSLRKITRSDLVEVLPHIPKSSDLFYIVWKQEESKILQNELIPKLSSGGIAPEVMISLLGLKYNLDQMSFLFQDHTPIKDSVQKVLDHQELLQDYQISPILIDTYMDRVQINHQYWQYKRGDYAFLLIRDINFNLMDTLSFWSKGTENVLFIHIISPPYLLRDYFCRTTHQNLYYNRKITSLAPRLSRTNWGIAIDLLERMSHSFISEQEIQSILNLVGIHEINVLEGINQFFKQQFKEDYRNAIEVKKSRRYSLKQKTFEEVVEYRFLHRIKEQITYGLYEFYDIVTESGKVLSSILKCHLYQQYLPFQFHSFNGQLYEIKAINNELKQIEVVYESLKENRFYRQNRKYEVSGKNGEQEIQEFADWLLKFELKETFVKVFTNGYFSFIDDITYKPTHMIYNPLTEKVRKQAERQYRNGKVLKITFSSKHEEILSKEKIKFTIAFLLNELFYTLFPTAYVYLATTTILSEDFFNDEKNKVEFLLQGVFPQLQTDDQEEDREISIYIIEDSPLQLGLLEAIHSNWMYILDILNEYLDWLLQDLNENGKFLRFGAEELSACFEFEKTKNLIQKFLPTKNWKDSKLGIMEKSSMVLDEEQYECDFCARSFFITNFEQLDDGRKRCFQCSQSAVNSIVELQGIYHSVRQYFIESFGLELRRNIHLKMISAKELQSISGLPFVPTLKYTPRIVGKAVLDKNKNIFVYIENGAPHIQTTITLAHELTHVWQFDYLNTEYLNHQEIEGMASWVEVHYARTIGEHYYADRIHEELLKRDDEYGEGYRNLIEIMEKHSNLKSPFDLYF